MVASLRFTFDGERRPANQTGERERAPKYPFFPRYMGPGFFPYPPPPREVIYQEKVVPQEDDQEKGVGQEHITKGGAAAVEVSLEKDKVLEQKVTEVKLEIVSPQEIPGQDTGSPTQDKKVVFNVSERLISNLNTAETGLNSFRVQVDAAKELLDDIIFKLDSFMQILEIIRSNEDRRLSGPRVQAAYQKTAKDAVDELLELLQTPAMQSVLRQLLLGLMAKR